MHHRSFIAPSKPARLLLTFSSLLLGATTFAPASHAAVIGSNVMPQRDQDLLAAASAGETWKVRDLLRRGARLEIRDTGYGFTPLMRAAAEGHVGTVRYLIERGAKVNAHSREGVAFQVAQASATTATRVSEPMETARGVRTGTALVQRRTTMLMTQSGGLTPLMLACAGGYNITARELIAHGADVNATTPDGDTALMYAAFRGYLPTVQTLLAKGADADAMERRRRQTVLEHAVLGGSNRIVKLLLDHGATVDVRDSYGTTAISLAQDREYHEMVRMLKAAAAKQRVSLPTADRNDQDRTNAPAAPSASEPGFIILN